MELYDIVGIQKCGIGIIFVNEFPRNKQFREGADEEKRYLKLLLKDEFSLEIFQFFDVTKKRMKDILLCLSGKKKMSAYPSIQKRHQVLVIAISSHGEAESIYTSDFKLFRFSDIKEYFTSENCPLLTSRPKMLLINCCRMRKRGEDKYDKAFPIESQELIVADGIHSPPITETETYEHQLVASNYSDFITVCLCARGVVSLRGTSSGSLAIKELYHSFNYYGHDSDFQSFMTRFTGNLKKIVYNRMKNHGITATQCPEVITTLDRPLIFPKKQRKKPEDLLSQCSLSSEEKIDISENTNTTEEGEIDQTMDITKMIPCVPNRYSLLLTLSNQSSIQSESQSQCESDSIFIEKDKHFPL